MSAFTAAQMLTSTFGQLGCRYMVFGVAWNGWDRSKGLPLAVAIANMAFYFAVLWGGTVLRHYGLVDSRSRLVVCILLVTPGNYLMMVAVVKLSSRTMRWKGAFGIIAILTIVEWVGAIGCQIALLAFYRLDNVWGRTVVRLVLPTALRRVWLHVNFRICLKFDVQDEGGRYLLLVAPVAATAIAGTCMQLSSGPLEAMMASSVALVSEVMDALTLLSGTTPLEQTAQSIKWAISTVTRSRTLNLSDLNSIGVDAPSVDPEAEARLQARTRRRQVLAATAVQVCLAETVCLVVVATLLILLPMNPNEIDGSPLDNSQTVNVLLISLAFELAGDGVTAACSSILSFRWPDKFVDVTRERGETGLPSIPGCVSAAILVFQVAETVALWMGSMCLSVVPADPLPTIGLCRL